MLRFLTDFADQAVILPMSAAVLLGLLALGWLRGAIAWGVCVGGVLTAMLALKLVGLACGNLLGWGQFSLLSPSGHTASACAVYGGLAGMLMPRSRRGEVAAWVLACGIAAIAGATRLRLHVHTPGEVALGALVGIIGAIALRHLSGIPPARVARPWLVMAGCAAVLALHGRRLNAESDLRWMAVRVWPVSMCATPARGSPTFDAAGEKSPPPSDGRRRL